MLVCDDVLGDPLAYRAAVLARPFNDVVVGTDIFHGIQLAEDEWFPAWIVERFPHLTPTLSFFRQSPLGQREPNYVHTDRSMGDWTAVLYLTPGPAGRRRHGVLEARAHGRHQQRGRRPDVR